MLDFLRIKQRKVERRGEREAYIEVSPSFIVRRSKDLMVRGGSLYAVWDQEGECWRTEVYDVVRLVDRALEKYRDNMPEEERAQAKITYMSDEETMKLSNFLRYCRSVDDWYVQLDQKVIFSNDLVKREDYSTKRLSYPMEEGDISSYLEMFSALYEPEELKKLEWAIGAIISGDSKEIQKFLVLYGAPGTGKSTFIDLVEDMFEHYAANFNARDLGDVGRQFALSSFKSGPLVAVEHEGDLSKIQHNALLNSIISHDRVDINEKHKTPYSTRINSFLVIGSNKQVKITDAYSGLIRRLIDVHPTGQRHAVDRYMVLRDQMAFELGAIAHHCLKVYKELGRNYYEAYRPTRMMFGTNALHNFVDYYYLEFSESEYTTLQQAFDWYRQYMEESNERFVLSRTEFREEMRAYFKEFEHRSRKFERKRNVFSGFKTELFERMEEIDEAVPEVDPLDSEVSLVDEVLKDCKAQYANDFGTPKRKWDEVTTTLSDLDTSKLHYVQPPLEHIVIDFDLTDEEGVKSRERNLEAARSWPATYTEWSKGGAGLHLHYIYAGDAERLSRVFSPGIEVKVFVGNASLRRMHSRSNGLPVATLTSGLPVKEEKLITEKEIKSEIGLRRQIEKNLAKMVHAGTKPSVDFIHKILNDAYKTDLVYDVTDMKPRIIGFAMNSTNQATYCLKLVQDMPFKSKEEFTTTDGPNDRLVFFDVEVFPNLFTVCWKYEDSPDTTRMINPTPAEVGELLKLRLVGFFNRKYDNHILYARYMGYDNARLFELSQKLVKNERTPFGAAYGISYCDIYDYAATHNKMSLKAWQIKLGIRHLELGIPWDQPVPEELWEKVLEYNVNDVVATEKLHKHLKGDFVARQILAELSGLTVNDTTNSHTTRIIFGGNKNPQARFNIPDLSEEFPGYVFDPFASGAKSSYLGHNPSEGGFVDSEPGMYENVSVYDVASMHPSSIIAMNMFGDEYTKVFKDLMDARLAIKHKDYDAARKMLGGKLEKYLEDPSVARSLSDALKVAINSVYGLTSASFDNPFRDHRNKDNVVAKRGALFMIKLMEEVRAKGYKVVHIKTDSIKIVDADEELFDWVCEFGREHGYSFEHEHTYSKFALVNDAAYVAKIGWSPDESEIGKWEAVAAQFKHPYVFKTLFSREPTGFDDLVEVKNVQGADIWIGPAEMDASDDITDAHHFVGRTGAFTPVVSGGGKLIRRGADGRTGFVSGTKDHLWKEAETEREESGGRYDNIDMSYFQNLVDKAEETLSKYGDVSWLTE